MKRVLLPAAALMLLALPARADLAAGQAAYANGEYRTAREELAQPAQAGEAEARYLLGVMYERGLGGERSDSRAWGWYKGAATAGHLDAILALAALHEFGQGVPRSTQKALELYTQAAEKGSLKAMARLGVMALRGQGRKPDLQVALKWLSRAAEGGEPEALTVLDELRAKGLVPRMAPRPSELHDPEVAAIVADVGGLLEPMGKSIDGTRIKLGGTLSAYRQGEAVVLLVPQLDIVDQDQTIRLGTVRAAFTKDGEDYKVDLAFSSKARVLDRRGREVGSLAVGGQSITGRWSPQLKAILDLRAELTRVAWVAGGGQLRLTADRVQHSRSLVPTADGRHDLRQVEQLTNAQLQAGNPRRGGTVRLGSLVLRTELLAVDLAALTELGSKLGLDWRTGAVSPDLLVRGFDLPGELPALARDTAMALLVEDFTLLADGRPVMSLASLDSGGLVAGLDADLGRGTLTVGLTGLTLPLADPSTQAALPEKLRLALTLDRLPTRHLARSWLARKMDMVTLGALSPGLRPVGAGQLKGLLDQALAEHDAEDARAMAEAGTKLQVDNIELAGPGYGLTMRGGFAPSGDRWSGGLDVEAQGLPALLALLARMEDEPDQARLGQDEGSLSSILRQDAIEETGPDGKPVHRLQLVLTPAGQLLINGRILGDDQPAAR